ncbi:MAG: hypothetical protein ACYDC2_02515 [Solirubrobacteraceae bacterium]
MLAAAAAPGSVLDAAAAPGSVLDAAHAQLSALHPRYVRLLIDWAALQPDPARPPALDAPVAGCARASGPCASYDGVAAELRALAAQQRSAPGGYQAVIDILGAPAWAVQPAPGCEPPGSAGAFARPLQPGALAAYRALVAALAALARREGAAVAWWSPWNEPNNPRFLSPQRAACSLGGAPLAPALYAQLAAAMAQQLAASGAPEHLLLGELGGYATGSADRLSVGEFLAALPSSLLCSAAAWSVHAYAARPPRPVPPDPVALLEAALGARGGCAASAPILVTETGAGAPEPGRPVRGAPGEEHAACLALAQLVLGWYGRPRVQAVFQYSFRDDPAFPVGLLSADLGRAHATYRMWLSLERARAKGMPPPAPARLCGGR